MSDSTGSGSGGRAGSHAATSSVASSHDSRGSVDEEVRFRSRATTFPAPFLLLPFPLPVSYISSTHHRCAGHKTYGRAHQHLAGIAPFLWLQLDAAWATANNGLQHPHIACLTRQLPFFECYQLHHPSSSLLLCSHLVGRALDLKGVAFPHVPFVHAACMHRCQVCAMQSCGYAHTF